MKKGLTITLLAILVLVLAVCEAIFVTKLLKKQILWYNRIKDS